MSYTVQYIRPSNVFRGDVKTLADLPNRFRRTETACLQFALRTEASRFFLCTKKDFFFVAQSLQFQ